MSDFPKIYRTLDLGEYLPEYAGRQYQVWVNQSQATLKLVNDLLHRSAPPDNASEAEQEDARQAQIAVLAWLAITFDAGEGSPTFGDITALATYSVECDPGFLSWIIRNVVKLIEDFRQALHVNGPKTKPWVRGESGPIQ